MTSLLDVNVLIALFDAAHVHHGPAHAWLAEHRAQGWATCPITQNGCVRVLSQPRYPGALPTAEAVRRLRNATKAADHVFWNDSISVCDSKRFDADRILNPKAVTDAYLLALARAHRGRLVTFDRAMPRGAVVGAAAESLVVL